MKELDKKDCTKCKYYKDNQFGYLPTCEESGKDETSEICCCFTQKESEDQNDD